MTVLNFVRQVYGLQPVTAKQGSLSPRAMGGGSLSPPRFTYDDGELTEGAQG